jgi:hypothetical protein
MYGYFKNTPAITTPAEGRLKQALPVLKTFFEKNLFL